MDLSKGIKWKLTWTYRSFFSDRLQRGKVKGSESRRYLNWGQKASHKLCLTANKFIRKQHLTHSLQGDSGTESPESQHELYWLIGNMVVGIKL